MKSSLRHLVILIGLAALACSPVLASNNTLRAHIEEPIVIGDQLFSGGTLELVQSGIGRDLLALRIDGEQIALISMQTYDRAPVGSRPYLLLETDERGFTHVIGMRFALKNSSETRYAERIFRPLVVDRGLATVPAHRVDTEPPEVVARSR